MTSAAQFTANAANAKLSTGPRTEEGKAASSQNALKHGLTAKTVLLPGEDEAEYQALKQQFFDFWKPVHVLDTQCVRNLVDTQWRINRCARLEVDALSKDEGPDYKALEIISKHEVRLKKLFTETLKLLHGYIKSRTEDEIRTKSQAMTIRQADKLRGRPTDFKALGFDFSVAEIDALLDFEDTFRRATEVVNTQNQWRQ
jgi:hypothetical protein